MPTDFKPSSITALEGDPLRMKTAGFESGAGILTTAGHLLFTADVDSNLMALDPATGKTLWHVSVGDSTENSPMTYELDGRQYVVMAVHDELFAFALPESTVRPRH